MTKQCCPPILLFLALSACDRLPEQTPEVHESGLVGDTAEDTDPDTDQPPEPPLLAALEGEGFALVWTSRPLEAGERVQRLTSVGGWVTIGHSGAQWLDPTEAASYRLVQERGEPVLAQPAPALLSVLEANTPGLLGPECVVVRDVQLDLPETRGLNLGLTIQRSDDGAWLADGADGPQWQSAMSPWTLTEEEPPEEISLEWRAAEGPSRIIDVIFTLLVDHEGEWLPLARAETLLVELGFHLSWGDLHAHTNLSYDGCEDPDNYCQPRGDTPGEDVFQQALDAGLAFAAVTDHAEFSTYTHITQDLQLDIWEHTLALVEQAEGSGVLPLAGYEWTARYGRGGHRTVIFEEPAPCADAVKGSRVVSTFVKLQAGFEQYDERQEGIMLPADFLATLDSLDCLEGRHLSWFHHPSINPPARVDWSDEVNRLGDPVVEIYSEHGSSECFDLDAEGCDWRSNPDHNDVMGSYQSALQHGHMLGIIAGSDNHEARPGGRESPGAVAHGSGLTDEEDPSDLTYWQHASAGVAGVLHPERPLTRAAIFDALEARATFGATTPLRGLRVAAIGSNRVIYLPGSLVPQEASPLELRVDLDDPLSCGWQVELLDEWNELWLIADGPVRELFDLHPGDTRYVRIRVFCDEDEERAWASPFFGSPWQDEE